MKERGAQFNGSTWLDRTNYYETLPASDENLEFAIRLEADRMINSPIKAEDLATEFSVVRNEFEAGENSPQRVLSQRMMAVAYEWHNYGKSTIGNRSDIERVPVDNLRAFYKRFYQPDNAVLVVAGKFDEKKALEYIEKYFGSIPKPDRKLPATYTEEPAQDGERFVTLRRVGSVGLVGVIYHVPAGSARRVPRGRDPGRDPRLRALGPALQGPGRDPQGVERLGLRPGRSTTRAPSTSSPRSNTKDRAELEKVRDTILSVVDEVARSGVTQEEVDRARQSILKDRELSLHDPNSIAIELSEWAAQGDWRLFFLHRDRIEKVTPAEVKEVAAKYLTASNRTVGFFLPTDQARADPDPGDARCRQAPRGLHRPQGRNRPRARPSTSRRRRSRPACSGPSRSAASSWPCSPRRTGAASVQMRLTLRYGNAENLKGFVEAGRIAPRADDAGHEVDDPPADRGRARQELRPARRRHGRPDDEGLGGGAGAGSVTFALETKRANLPAVLEILRQILREPTLPESEFEVLKREDDRRHRAGPHRPDAPGLQPLPARLRPVSERRRPLRPDRRRAARADAEALPRSGPHPVPRVPRRRPRRARDRSATSSPPRSCRSWARPSRAGRPRSPTRGSSGRSRPA